MALTAPTAYALLFAAYALEGASLPFPAELVSLATGPALAAGRLPLWASVLAGALGQTCGALAAYAAGRAWARRGGGPGGAAQPALRERAELVRRWGPWLVFAARWFGFLRPVALLGAGAVGVPRAAFAAASLVAGVLYCGLWQLVAWHAAGLARRWLSPSLLAYRAVPGLAALVAGVALLRRLLAGGGGPGGSPPAGAPAATGGGA